MKIAFWFSVLACATAVLSPSAAARIKVAATHPLIGSLVRDVGGGRVEVIDLVRPGADLHHFEPSPRDFAALHNAVIVFASGKNLENYLDKLRDSLGAGTKILEIGRTIPSIRIDPGEGLFLCCPENARGGIDPHWWHSAENMARAARIVATELAAADPEGADEYRARGSAVAKEMQALKSWAEREISAIPKADRKLVTAHAAFGYFCREFGFKSLPVLGSATEEGSSPRYAAEATQLIRQHGIRAVFPEDQANPKVLAEIVRATGVKVSRTALIADGTSSMSEGATFERMLKHNVNAIVEALAPERG